MDFALLHGILLSSYLHGTHLHVEKRVSGEMPRFCELSMLWVTARWPKPSTGPPTTATSPSSVSKGDEIASGPSFRDPTTLLNKILYFL